MRTLMTGLAVLAIAAGAAAKDLKVPSTTYPTIQDAANAAASGDRILIGKGVYFENVTMTQSNVQVIGKGATMDGNLAGVNGAACLTLTGDSITVTGLTFRFGKGMVSITGNDAHVLKCKCLRSGGYNTDIKIVGNNAVVSGCTSLGALNNFIVITGNGALVSKNKVSHGGEYSIQVTGTDAQILGNTVTILEDSNGIRVIGAGATVEKNKVSFTDGDSIYVDSDNCHVNGNTVFAGGDENINVKGDNVEVSSNKVSFSVDDSDCIRVASRTAAGGGTVEKNKTTDSVEYGIYCSTVYNLAIRDNVAERCGTENEAGFYITGNGNTIENNVSTGANDAGFYVEGNTNTLTGNKASGCQAAGFGIKGSGNTLTGCTATSCLGEGLNNLGTGTNVQNCTFKSNRIDVAADLANSATFGTFTGNTFVSGGTGTQSEVK